MPFRVYASNRLEQLSSTLAESLKTPLPSPLMPETIVVQSRGMERWLSLEIARKHGICGNFHFPFPNAFVREIAGHLIADLPERSIFEASVMAWRIMGLLPDMLRDPAFEKLRHYLREPDVELKTLQLVTRIADVFDQYLLYRPEMVLRWEQGQDNHWQAQLWRELVRTPGELHRAALGKYLLEQLKNSDVDFRALPQRCSIFGISSLPEFHLQFFDALSRHVEVNFFLLNPCREYWGEIRSKKEVSKTVAKAGQLAIEFTTQHFEQGNTLLSSLGKMGRDFFDLIEGGFDYHSESRFVEPDESSLLGSLQSDIVNLRDRETETATKNGKNADRGGSSPLSDRSIQFHSCHSEHREIEVLHDNLLDIIEQNPALEPGDILIMAPDIEPYVPFIKAVFDLPAEDTRRLPYSIADRTFQREFEVVESFFMILDLVGSRFSTSQILNVLEIPAIQKQFNIKSTDQEVIHAWIVQARIHWGIDAEARKQQSLPVLEQNTWKNGLERLLLGYALPGHGTSIYDQVLPLDIVEGNQSMVLGNFLEFTHKLFATVNALDKKRTLQGWAATFEQIIEDFFAIDEQTAHQIQTLRAAISELSSLQTYAEFGEEVELRTVRHHLQNQLRQDGYGFGFLSGGITFCSMLPMRSIPASVICLIGMNNERYPRSSRQLSFDLIAQNPRLGDRSRRKDDRYLFLEAILSARQTLYISFVGQSVKDNTSIPPSVLVSEMMTYISKNYKRTEEASLEEIVVKHRLQAFNPDYFQAGSLFSYSEENLKTAQALCRPRTQPPAFFPSGILNEPDANFRTVNLEDLYRFFRNPLQFLFNKRLQFRLREDIEMVNDTEPFTLRGLDRYDIANELLYLEGDAAHAFKSTRKLSGQLPHGAVGEAELDVLSERVNYFSEKMAPFMAADQLAPLNVDSEIDDFRLIGKVSPIFTSGLVFYRYAAVRAKDHLRAWLYHLALNFEQPGGYPNETVLGGVSSMKDGVWAAWRFRAVTDAAKILKDLLQLYWLGLHRPIRFFPESALAYYQTFSNPKKKDTDALLTAGSTWQGGERDGGERIRGEIDNPYFHRCFVNDQKPLNDEFKELAKLIWRPVFENREAL